MALNFIPNPLCSYKFDYEAIFTDIANGHLEEIPTYRELAKNDLFFIVYFIFCNTISNHPFVVEACKEVEQGPQDFTIDLWARGHFKSTIVTKASILQDLVKNPEERIAIMSYTRPAAKMFFREIKLLLESSTVLHNLFPEIFYKTPASEAPKWSEDDGIYVKRIGSYQEASLEAWGLTEGMPTGKHFTKRYYDDIETADLVQTPEMISKVKNNFFISCNLKSLGGTHKIVGTPYSHAGPLQYLRELKDAKGNPIYLVRIKPATDDGTINGKPVLLSEQELESLKVDEQSFNSQQLLDPSPVGVRKLDGSYFKVVHPDYIPEGLVKVMIVDPAGDDKNGKGDSWAFGVFGVLPNLDDLGRSKVYLLDAEISPLREEEAPQAIADMYRRNGYIETIGVEKVALSTTEIHVANALAQKGYILTVANKGITILRPGGREKKTKIARALAYPLYAGNIFVSSFISSVVIERLKEEANKFPYWHDDGLDMLAYLWDLLGSQGVSWSTYEEPEEEVYEDTSSQNRSSITGY